MFDGASQNNLCGGGVILNLDENQSFELNTGLGAGNNNRVELLSLQLLLIFAAEKGCRTLHIFSDSLNVINWVKNNSNLQWPSIRKHFSIYLGCDGIF